MKRATTPPPPPKADPTPGPYVKVKYGMGNYHIASPHAPDATTEARYNWIAEVKTAKAGSILYLRGKTYHIQPGEEDANARLFENAWDLLQEARALLVRARREMSDPQDVQEIVAVEARIRRIEAGP